MRFIKKFGFSLSLLLIGNLGCQQFSPPAARPKIEVLVNWDALVRSHPLQKQFIGSISPVKLISQGAQPKGDYSVPDLALSPDALFTLSAPVLTPKKTSVTILKASSPSATDSEKQDEKRFASLKQRLWEAELQSNRLVALSEEERTLALKTGDATGYKEDGLLEYLQESYRLLSDEYNKATDERKTLLDPQITKVASQIKTVEKVQMQLPAVDLAISILEKQLESLPRRGVFPVEEVDRLTLLAQPAMVKNEEQLQDAIGIAATKAGEFSDQARFEVGAQVYRSYRRVLEEQLQGIRQEAQAWQLEEVARQRATSEKKIKERLLALQQTTPPGLVPDAKNVAKNVAKTVAKTMLKKQNGGSEAQQEKNQLARFYAEKKRLDQQSVSGSDSISVSQKASLSLSSKTSTISGGIFGVLQAEEKEQERERQLLQAFIEQDCVMHLNEVARVRGYTIHLKYGTDHLKHGAEIGMYPDKTQDFIHWMWGYQKEAGI